MKKSLLLCVFLGGVSYLHFDTIHNLYETEKELELANKTIELNKAQEYTYVKDYNELWKEHQELTNEYNSVINKNQFFKNITFNPRNVMEKSNISKQQLKIIFKMYDEYKELQGLEKILVEVEEEFGINALFILGIISQETGYNTSERAINDNNMGGIQVYNDSSEGMSFKTKEESIVYIAELLKNDYLDKKGKYYNGEDVYSINENYCVTPEEKYSWSENIIKICNTYVERINDLHQ